MRHIGVVTMVLALACVVATAHDSTSGQEAEGMRIRLMIDGRELSATLLDNATSRDFVSLLPLELTLEDYASTEKIAHPPRRLSTDGAPVGIDPEPGDIAYYAPWGNLAIFYRDFGYSTGLVKLGRIDGDVGALAVRGALKARIERVDARGR